MRTSWIAAIVMTLALVLWMASGLLKTKEQESATDAIDEEQRMSVEVRLLEIKPVTRKITLHGQTEPAQHLFVRAETSGTIQNYALTKGSRVKKGRSILQLDLGDRQNSLAEAKARVKIALSEQKAAQSLRKQRLQSQLQLDQANAALETDRAHLSKIELDIARTSVTAAFNGIINDLPMDIGSLVERGDVVAELVDDSAFTVSAQAAQQSLKYLQVGQTVEVKLITGEKLTGTLAYISAVADEATRSFRIEAQIDNTNQTITAGLSAALSVPLEQIDAAFISPSTLSLGNKGELGVKIVNDSDTVVYTPIELVSTSLEGAWVSGIPAGSRVITLGQGFINPGEVVTPVLVSTTKQSTSGESR